MAKDDIDNDEYVANLLKQEATSTAKKYEMVGLDAFAPQRSRNGAPKPNTNFLRHIIRQTDNHNAALLAKEAEESRARLKEMNRESERKERQSRGAGRLTPPPALSDDEKRDRKRKRTSYSDDNEGRSTRRRSTKHQGASRESRSKRDRERDRDTRREERRHEHSGDESSNRRSRHSKRSHGKERRHKYDSSQDPDRKHRRRRASSRSASRSPSPGPRSHRHHRLSSRRHDSSPERRRAGSKNTNEARHSKRQSPAPDSESDPLEAIVGPLPPPPQPTIRSRGRGAHKANSMAMDARFSTTYDPSADVHLNSDVEDDWGDALEALKDRQRWKQQGAERLKAAGFSDEQVKKWEKGDEKTEEDVRWATKGEGREWDRGKVVDEDGDVDVKAEWGRLK